MYLWKIRRIFNTTDLCNPEDHYMVYPFRNMYENILHLINLKQYFLVLAPRQTGKTAFLHALAHRLNKEGNYVSVVCSLESAGNTSISVETANINFIKALAKMSKLFIDTEHLPSDIAKYISAPAMLGDYPTDWSDTPDKLLVLLLDEVDALYDDVLPVLKKVYWVLRNKIIISQFSTSYLRLLNKKNQNIYCTL